MTWQKQATGRELDLAEAIRTVALAGIRNEARIEDEQLLLAIESLTRQEDLLRGHRQLLVAMLRDRKVTWDEIGLYLGVSKSSAQQRYGKYVSDFLDHRARQRLTANWNG